jgi:AAA family ATP:ADP antiporter
VIGPFRVLLSTPLLRQLTLHTLLINVLVSGVWYERADAVLAAFENEKDRFTFFSVLNFCVAAITLVIQSFCFSRVLSKIGTTATLLCEPLALALGLVCTIIQPGIASIAILDGFRKVVHYSLLKPTKESLYAALPTEVQYKAKPLLDTFVYRSGSVVGAAYFTWALKTGMSAVERRTFLLILTLFWIVNSYFVGVEAERHHAKEKGTVLV